MRRRHGRAGGVGATGDYKNLDALVYDAFQTLLDPVPHDPSLVAVVGRDLMHDKLFPLVSDPDFQREARRRHRAQSAPPGRPACSHRAVFPGRKVSSSGSIPVDLLPERRAPAVRVIDNPKRDGIEHYESSNDAYVVEDYGLCARDRKHRGSLITPDGTTPAQACLQRKQAAMLLPTRPQGLSLKAAATS